ncbi:MAG TPA: mercuric reductase, partial [Candidatus Polarisedimenticolia bacterium]|nr:mercuric reductase [Candidatus Polarisedimenticolia bacterium]
FAAVMRRMRRLRADLSPVDSVARFRDLGVDVFFGDGRFVDPGAVQVGVARLCFRRAVIATGGRPALPPCPGLAEAEPLTNETVFWLEELPRRLLVIGAGPIGCEMAQAFARFGSEVTLVNRGPQLLPREDRDAAAVVEQSMLRDGVRLQLGAKLLSAERSGGERILHYERDGRRERAAADQILVATGRLPNVEGLGLDRAGVAVGDRGVAVDRRLRTSNRRVYAVGDVCSRYQFTHVADAHARIVVQNALFFGRARADRLVIPWCTYTSPEIAHVGMYEADAERAGIASETHTRSIEELDRAVLDGSNEGFVRVHLKKGTDRILGATIVAEHAGDLISELTLAITAGVGLGRIAATIHPYPTQGEMVRKVADAWRRTRLTPTVQTIFQHYFRIVR